MKVRSREALLLSQTGHGLLLCAHLAGELACCVRCGLVAGVWAVVREQLAPAACCMHGGCVDVCGVGAGRYVRGLVCTALAERVRSICEVPP